jgi:hypothetical protein
MIGILLYPTNEVIFRLDFVFWEEHVGGLVALCRHTYVSESQFLT